MTGQDQNLDAAMTIAALEENLLALWSRFGRGDGCTLHEEPWGTWFDTPIPTVPYNAVLRFTADADVDARIDAVFAHYAERGVPFAWFVHPTATPLNLLDRLEARGLVEAEVCPGMSMPLADLPPHLDAPQGIDVTKVSDAKEASGFLELVGWRWNVPLDALPGLPGVTRAFDLGNPAGPVRCWTARQDGMLVAKVLLHLMDGVAGIYGVATRPEARGQGLASVLTLEALHEARREGYRDAVLHSTPMARSLYERMGFRTYADFRIFAPPGMLHL